MPTDPDRIQATYSLWQRFMRWEQDARERGSGLTKDQMTGAAIGLGWLAKELGVDLYAIESPRPQAVAESGVRLTCDICGDAFAAGLNGKNYCQLHFGHECRKLNPKCTLHTPTPDAEMEAEWKRIIREECRATRRPIPSDHDFDDGMYNLARFVLQIVRRCAPITASRAAARVDIGMLRRVRLVGEEKMTVCRDVSDGEWDGELIAAAGQPVATVSMEELEKLRRHYRVDVMHTSADGGYVRWSDIQALIDGANQ